MFKENHKIEKLTVQIENDGDVLRPRYFLDGSKVELKPGDRLKMRYKSLQCSSCNRAVKKLFDSFCYPCLRSRATADLCITSPHLCHFNKGTCREPSFGADFCFSPHVLYVSYTDKFKVGITREPQKFTRWIDQGATAAAVLAKVTSRYQAGVLEKFVTSIVPDKSHWSSMLKAGNSLPSTEDFALTLQRVKAFVQDSEDFKTGKLTVEKPAALDIGSEVYFEESPRVVHIQFPLTTVPEKIKSLTFDKNPEIEGEILGIKGQYLFFAEGAVNMRRHEGYVIDFEHFPQSVGSNQTESILQDGSLSLAEGALNI